MTENESKIFLENKEFETKEIRGVSMKTLITVIISTATIVGSIIASGSRLSGQIRDTQQQIEIMKVEKSNDAKYNDLRLKILEKSLEVVDKRIDALDIIINQFKK